MLESLQETVVSWARSGGLLGIALAMTVENLVQVVPSLMILPLTGHLSAQGVVNLPAAIAASITADPGIRPQPHHVMPLRAILKAAEQLSAGTGPVCQDRDGSEPPEQTVGPLQQGDHHLSTGAGLGCSSVCQSSGMARPWQTTESTTTQKRFQSTVVSRARCKVWPGFYQF